MPARPKTMPQKFYYLINSDQDEIIATSYNKEELKNYNFDDYLNMTQESFHIAEVVLEGEPKTSIQWHNDPKE